MKKRKDKRRRVKKVVGSDGDFVEKGRPQGLTRVTSEVIGKKSRVVEGRKRCLKGVKRKEEALM